MILTKRMNTLAYAAERKLTVEEYAAMFDEKRLQSKGGPIMGYGTTERYYNRTTRLYATITYAAGNYVVRQRHGLNKLFSEYWDARKYVERLGYR